jgi:hypothetical protein
MLPAVYNHSTCFAVTSDAAGKQLLIFTSNALLQALCKQALEGRGNTNSYQCRVRLLDQHCLLNTSIVRVTHLITAAIFDCRRP